MKLDLIGTKVVVFEGRLKFTLIYLSSLRERCGRDL